MGDPARLLTDIGPVIDAEAKTNIDRHVSTMRSKGRKVYQQVHPNSAPTDTGTFVPPTLIELNSLADLQREVFGPVLHFVRYRRNELDAVLEQINGTGYGLTLGVHTRIDETIARVVAKGHAGNVYVNRNMVGAVVGVQPFGGEGLSGTGPKAGGPLYMYRLLSRYPDDAMVRAVTMAGHEKVNDNVAPMGPLRALQQWAVGAGQEPLATACERFAAQSRTGAARVLPGPTGESNVYTLLPRAAVLCLAATDADRLLQLAAVLAVGSQAVWPSTAAALYEQLPRDVQERIVLVRDWMSPTVAFDAVLLHDSEVALLETNAALARREGPIIGVQRLALGETDIPLERLLVERSLSVNTAAAGGNASLMTIG